MSVFRPEDEPDYCLSDLVETDEGEVVEEVELPEFNYGEVEE